MVRPIWPLYILVTVTKHHTEGNGWNLHTDLPTCPTVGQNQNLDIYSEVCLTTQVYDNMAIARTVDEVHH